MARLWPCHSFFCSVSISYDPGWMQCENLGIDRTRGDMSARQIAEAHEKLADDLAAREDEGAAEQLDPLRYGQGVMRVEPGGEGTMRPAQIDQPLRVGDRRGDLQPIADDAGIEEKAFDIAVAETGDAVDIPTAEGCGEGFALLQDGQPGEPGL